MQIDFEVFRERLLAAIDPEPLYGWAAKNGINKATLNGAMTRRAIPKAEMLAQMASASGRSIDWLLGLEPPAEPKREVPPQAKKPDEAWTDFMQVPLYEVAASAGHGSQIDGEGVKQYLPFRRDFLRDVLRIPNNGLYCVKVRGNSMEPILRNGHPVLIQPTDGEVLYEGPYLLRLEGALLLKNLQRLPGGRLRIWSENQTTNSFPPIEVDWPPREGVDIQVFGRVRWSDNIF